MGEEKTQYRGILKKDTERAGEYYADGNTGMTMLPEVSGEGGYGGPGEYNKYPETDVAIISGDFKSTEMRKIAKVSFLDEPPRREVFVEGKDLSNKAPVVVTPAAPVVPAEPAPVEKPGKRKRVVKHLDSPVVEAPQQAPVELTKQQVVVVFEGVFGKMAAPFDEVFIDGHCLVMRSGIGGFHYEPPVTEEPLKVTVFGNEMMAYSVGVAYMEPSSGKRVVVLITA